MTFFKGLN